MIRGILSLGLVASLCSCTTALAPGQEDAVNVVKATLVTLTADRKAICLDNSTSGDAMSEYRNMMSVPKALRQIVVWREPQPMRPPAGRTNWDLFTSEIREDNFLLPPQKQNIAALPLVLQQQLNAAAGRLTFVKNAQTVEIGAWKEVPLAQANWWLVNRLKPDCSPIYKISNPKIAKNLAFITVKADHWGTTYVLTKQNNQWKPVGQWAGSIY